VNLPLLLVVSIFAGVLPMICWSVLIWWFDRYEKEPIQLLLVSFLWGMLPSIGISFALELFLNRSIASYLGFRGSDLVFLDANIFAPIIEEGVKLLGLVGIFLVAQKEIDDPLDGIIYGAMVGFGFAAGENFLYFFASRTVAELLLLIFLRTMIFGSLHAMFTSFIGFGLALAKYARNRWRAAFWVIGGFILAVGFHIVHNLGLFWVGRISWAFYVSLFSFAIGFLLIVLLFIGSLRREQKVIRRYLVHLSGEGILPSDQLETAGSMRKRWRTEWGAIQSLNFSKYFAVSRLHTIYTELAFKEKQRQLWGKDSLLEKQIADLIREMQELLRVHSTRA
jgi:RsiW-degrading membrane proteinase PrsW (M82 family)